MASLTLPPPTMFPWQRIVKNLKKELALLKQELAIHNSLVSGQRWGRRWLGAGGMGIRVPGGQKD